MMMIQLHCLLQITRSHIINIINSRRENKLFFQVKFAISKYHVLVWLCWLRERSFKLQSHCFSLSLFTINVLSENGRVFVWDWKKNEWASYVLYKKTRIVNDLPILGKGKWKVCSTQLKTFLFFYHLTIGLTSNRDKNFGLLY